MSLTLRQKHWAGAIISLLVQTAIFIPLDIFAGHWISAMTMALINIGLAASYKNDNPYLVGARWGSFFTMSFVSIARHVYWYPAMLASFIRLRDFNRPLGMNDLLCNGNSEAAVITVTTSLLVLCFYFFTPKWHEWHGRWEMLRRAPFSASLGFQAIIVVTVVHPTALTMTCALFFASVISPILRRQVRLNHIVFMMMVPLFSLGNPTLAFIWSLICGFLFIYAVSVERSLTINVASFSFFNGIAFLALSVSLLQNPIEALGATATGLYALFAFLLLMGVSYILVFKGDAAMDRIREAQLALTPRFVRDSAWWNIRDLWVDLEVAHRTGKLYKWKEMDKTIGLFFFGPRDWAVRSEMYDQVPYPRMNFTPSILVLTIYSLFLGVDAVLFLTTGSLLVTVGGLMAAFLLILGAPFLLLRLQWKDRAFFKAYSFSGTGMTFMVLGAYMVSILYFGFTSTEAINNAAQNLDTRTPPPMATTVTKDDCPCNEESAAFPGM